MTKRKSTPTSRSICDGFGGDIYRRVLRPGSEDLYVCGCEWRRDKRYGDVLHLCAIHRAHSDRGIK